MKTMTSVIATLLTAMVASGSVFAQDASDGVPGDAPARNSGEGGAGVPSSVTAFSVQSNGNDHLYSIDLSTGASTDLGLVGITDAEGLAFANGPLDAIGGTLDELWDISVPPGVLIGPTGARSGTDAGMATDPTSGTTYNTQDGTLYTVNTTDGSTALVGSGSNFADGLGINCSGQAFASDAIFADGLYTVDLTNGSMAFVGGFGIGDISEQSGLAFDASGTLWMLLSSGDIYTVNTDTGAAAFVAQVDVGGGFEGLAIENNCQQQAPRATFAVTKDFTDGNPDEVEVTISCTTGLPIEQSQGVSEAQPIEFVVIEYDDGELACEITEEPVPGYQTTYDDGTLSSTSCAWEGIAGGAELTCDITNTPAPVEIDIVKDWVFEGTTTGDGIDLRYELTLFCDAEIVGGDQIGGRGVEAPAGNGPSCGFVLASQEGNQGIIEIADWCKVLNGEGPGDATHTAEVIPEYPDSNCYVVENVFDNAVEVDNRCTSLTVSAGQGDSCTITNTVFFEGIPTLNQYGLAVLALLMLGIGAVGFRRFA